MISNFPLVLFVYEVSFNVSNYKICNFWEQAKQILWGTLEIIESEEWWIFEESDKFDLNKTSKMEPDKLDAIDAEKWWSKTNNFAKAIFPISVHFIKSIKGFW